MKQKVQIDVLDVSLYEINHHDENQEINDSLLPYPHKYKFIKPKRIIFFISISIIILFIFYFINMFLNLRASMSKRIDKKIISSSNLNSQTILLEDFMVNFIDENGKARILICQFALELKVEQKDKIRNDCLAVRKIVFSCLQSKSPSAGDKIILKDEIMNRVNKQIGGNYLTRVYITKFIIL